MLNYSKGTPVYTVGGSVYLAWLEQVDLNFYIETGKFRWQAIKKNTYEALLYTMDLETP